MGHGRLRIFRRGRTTASPTGNGTEGAAAPATTAAPSVPAAQAVSGATPDQVRAIVNAALDAKLGPIRRDLAAQVNAGPGIQEIIGGINGWGWWAWAPLLAPRVEDSLAKYRSGRPQHSLNTISES